LNTEVITPSLAFTDLGLVDPILRAISDAGYTTPTPIQAKAIPQVLSGGDLLAGAQTGTGKTAGFTLPLLHMLTSNPPKHPSASGKSLPRCLILTPTRELAAQVEESVKTYGKYLALKSMVIFGGVSINPQIRSLAKPLDIIVATPGRLLDHASQKTVDLSGIEILVLDEADRMLDMGFIRDIKKILAMLPKQRQNLLFSATFSDEIKQLSDGLLNNPAFVEVARRNTSSELVEQTVHLVRQAHKRDLVSYLIKKNDWKQVLIFTRTKHGANRLADKLIKDGIPAMAIHGNKSQNARTKALADFKDGSIPVLVATDIAARGLDIDQLPQVVNFELPNVPEDYVHRIGRTGRAGSSGSAISLVDEEETKFLKDIEKLIKRDIPKVKVEGFEPPTKIEPEPPRLFRGQQPNRGQAGIKPAGQGQNKNTSQARNQRTDGLPNTQRNEQKTTNSSNNRPSNNRNGAQPNGQKAQENRPRGNSPTGNAQSNSKQNLSEAARHQAQPQQPLFVPKSPNRHSGNRGR